MQFTILTSPLSGNQKLLFDFKNIIKKILGFNTFGPKYVLESIFEGLKELNNDGEEIIYNINPKEKVIFQIVFVPNGIETLKYAINLKKKGKINKIIAGPNISVPNDKNDIIFNKEIDQILVPSKWVKNYFVNLNTNEKRINIWPSGTVDNGKSKKSSNKILIYRKNCFDELYNHIISILDKNKINYSIIGYGNFNKNDYYKYLDECIGMIYLQESESQGLALHESWIKDIPTFVWNRGYWEYNGNRWNDEKISAPYLNENCGMFFNGINDFEKLFNTFYNNINKFKSREYSLKHFTNKITTKYLLSIIKNNEHN